MAGKELRGVGAAEASLFEGRTYFFCPDNPAVLEHPFARQLLDYVAKFGAHPVLLESAAHDRLVSLTSHLSQLASTGLAACLAKHLDPAAARNGAGPGLLDMTRLSQSSYELWTDILATNLIEIDSALGSYIEELQQIRINLADSKLTNTFERAANFGRFIRKPRTKLLQTLANIHLTL